jgi:hypothetical protein
MAMSIKQLFPSDIINIILQYTDNNIIIQLQDYFPYLLKNITINEKEFELINKNNYQYIRKFNCSNSKNITNNSIKYLTQLTQLDCSNCPNMTDDDIKHLVRLTTLYCGNCPDITDYGIKNLVLLTKLNCWCCPNITNSMQQIIRNRNKN